MRQMFDEESRSERRKTAAKPTEGQPQAGLTPWREIISPHADVASGRFDQAEFAATCSRSRRHRRRGVPGPEGVLRSHLSHRGVAGSAGRRSAAPVGRWRRPGDRAADQLRWRQDPQHDRALPPGVRCPGADLPGVGEALAEEGVDVAGEGQRAVLVGQMISPSAPEPVEDGVLLHTLWGHLAYQLGGREGVRAGAHRRRARHQPGRALKQALREVRPGVVLIDEWVAYARQLRDGGDGDRLAGGDFDTQFTFAQALTEAAAPCPNVVVLVSIPASDIEVGGDRGKTALEKLKNVVTRKAKQWQPASPDESFEIVRRRCSTRSPDKAKVRDGVIRRLPRCTGPARRVPVRRRRGEYRRRMELSYPIHPELFDRLFNDWSALDKFQRTRGVLRLMALAISQLWQRGDQSLLIMPGNLPMDSGALVSAR
jgi:hypothetical protein